MPRVFTALAVITINNVAMMNVIVINLFEITKKHLKLNIGNKQKIFK